MQKHIEAVNMKRREFITGAASAAAGMACMWTARRVYGAEDAAKPVRVRIGFLSDSHYANVDYAWAGDNRFHVCQRMRGASTFRLKPPRRIGRASRVEYNPLTGSVGIVPNSSAWRKGTEMTEIANLRIGARKAG